MRVAFFFKKIVFIVHLYFFLEVAVHVLCLFAFWVFERILFY